MHGLYSEVELLRLVLHTVQAETLQWAEVYEEPAYRSYAIAMNVSIKRSKTTKFVLARCHEMPDPPAAACPLCAALAASCMHRKFHGPH